MPKRCPAPKDGQLRMCHTYSPDDGWDIHFIWGDGCSKRDASLLNHVLCSPRPNIKWNESTPTFSNSLLEDLEERGYDITTLNFTIEKKRNEP